MEASFSTPVQTGLRTHPASYTMGTESFPWAKGPGRGVDNPPPSSGEINPLKPELIPICYLLALLAHHFFHVGRIRVKSLTIRLLMSYIYIYMEHLFLMFLDHTQRRSTVGRTPLDE